MQTHRPPATQKQQLVQRRCSAIFGGAVIATKEAINPMPTKLLFASDPDARALPFSLSSAARYGVHVVTFEFSFVTATRSGRRVRRPADSTLRRELFAATESMSGPNRFVLGGEGLGADVAAQVVEMDANPRIDGLFYLNPTFQTVSGSNRRLWKQSSLSELKAPTLTVFSKDEDGQPSPTVKAKEMSWLLADGVPPVTSVISATGPSSPSGKRSIWAIWPCSAAA